MTAEPTPRPSEATVTLTVTFDVGPAADGGIVSSADQLATLLADYLVDEMGDLKDAYGPDAAGGYDGPYIKAIRVRGRVDRPGPSFTVERHAEWGERDSEEDDRGGGRG